MIDTDPAVQANKTNPNPLSPEAVVMPEQHYTIDVPTGENSAVVGKFLDQINKKRIGLPRIGDLVYPPEIIESKARMDELDRQVKEAKQAVGNSADQSLNSLEAEYRKAIATYYDGENEFRHNSTPKFDTAELFGLKDEEKQTESFRTVAHFLNNIQSLYIPVFNGLSKPRGNATLADVEAFLVDALEFSDRIYNPENHQPYAADEVVRMMTGAAKVKGATLTTEGDVANLVVEPELAIDLTEMVWNAGKANSAQIGMEVKQADGFQTIKIKNDKLIDPDVESNLFTRGVTGTASTGEGLNLISNYVHDRGGFITYSSNGNDYRVDGDVTAKLAKAEQAETGEVETQITIHLPLPAKTPTTLEEIVAV